MQNVNRLFFLLHVTIIAYIIVLAIFLNAMNEKIEENVSVAYILEKKIQYNEKEVRKLSLEFIKLQELFKEVNNGR